MKRKRTFVTWGGQTGVCRNDGGGRAGSYNSS